MQFKHILTAALASAALVVVASCATQSETHPTPAPAPAPAATPTPPPAPSGAAAAAIQQRQGAMRQIGGAARTLQGLAAATPVDVNAMRAQGATLAQIAAQLPSLFPAGSGAESGVPTRAGAAIWSNAAGWSEQTRGFNSAAQALANASTPEAATAAVRQLGGTCGSCHSQFRAPQGS